MPLMLPDQVLPDGLVATPLPVDRVLYDAEEPIVYLTQTVHGQALLAYVADVTPQGVVTLLSPISTETLTRLEQGALGIREALASSWIWMHSFDGERARLAAGDIAAIPEDHLPRVGTPLLPTQQPVLRTRAVGESLILGRMPASVVSFVADSTRKAFKTVLDFVFAVVPDGRPTDEHRALFDLPIQQFGFSSFELAFGAPYEGIFEREEVQLAAEKLRHGLAWASNTNDATPFPARDDEERAVILRAALLLTPPSSGPIEAVEVSGSWVSERAPIRLTRASRVKVRRELQTVIRETVVKLEGRVGELDVDNCTFILRDTPDGIDRKGAFNEADLDDLKEYFVDQRRVAIAAVVRQGKLYIGGVAPAGEASGNSLEAASAAT